MNRKVRTVYLKELRDMLRDRRTIFATIAIPVLLYPLLTIAMSEVSQIAAAKLNRESFPIAVLPGTKDTVLRIHKRAIETPPPIKGLDVKEVEKKAPRKQEEKSVKEIVEAQKNAGENDEKKAPAEETGDVEEVKTDRLKSTKFDFQEMPADAASEALSNGTVRAILIVPADIERSLAAGERPEIRLEYDRAERTSESAHGRLTKMLERYESAILQDEMKKHKLVANFLHPFIVEEQNVARAEKLGGSIFGSVLPLMVILVLMTGAMTAAMDLTAGEKERSTLETLIGSPARPIEIIAGKFLAVLTLSMMNATLNLASCAISIKSIPLPANLEISFPWSVVPLTFVLLVPLAMFFSALLLMVASFAANIKEAQIFSMPVFLGSMVSLALGMIPGVELEGPLLLIPVVNTAMLIKELFLGHGTAQQIAFVFFSTCLYAAGMVALAARVFAREEVLFSAQGSLRLFLSRRFFKAAKRPKAGDALLAAAVLFPMYFYLQSYIQKYTMVPGKGISVNTLTICVVLTMYGIFLTIPLLVAKYLKAEWKTTFLWSAPPWRGMLGAGLMGATSWIIANQIVALQSRFWSYPDSKELEGALRAMTETPGGIALLIFLVAISPAICEEHFFRGFLQQGLLGPDERRWKKWATILLVGAVFGFYHIPVFRQPVTAMMGVALAWMAFETRSLWPGVLMHFMNNALALFGVELFRMKIEQPAPGQHLPDMPAMYLFPGIGVFIAGILLIRGSRRAAQNESGGIAAAAPNL